MAKKKDAAAVRLGRRGGKASAKTRTTEERAEYARDGWKTRRKREANAKQKKEKQR